MRLGNEELEQALLVISRYCIENGGKIAMELYGEFKDNDGNTQDSGTIHLISVLTKDSENEVVRGFNTGKGWVYA